MPGMGMRNRERRREKQRRRMRAAGHGGSARPTTARATVGNDAGHASGAFDAAMVESVVLTAAHAFGRQDETTYNELVTVLVSGPPVADGSRLVGGALARCLERALGDAWKHGWQPADVARVTERKLTQAHVRAVAAAITAEAARYAPATLDALWQAQLQELSQEAAPGRAGRRPAATGRDSEVRCAVETLSLMLRLPELPRLCPRPGEATGMRAGHSMTDERVLGRVRALLAKAESTNFPDEAEALTAKAQELMARHAVDQAMLDSREGTTATPSGRRLGVDDPYSGAKALLLNEVAMANRCRSVWSQEFGFATVFGHEPDIAAVELLYTSLLVQANAAMTAAGSQVDIGGRSRTRSFRQSFLVAFATRIGSRLREATEATEAAAAEEHGAALLPVLAARTDAVDEACDAAFPGLTQRSFSPSNAQGWFAGLAAAEVASLSAYPEMARST